MMNPFRKQVVEAMKRANREESTAEIIHSEEVFGGSLEVYKVTDRKANEAMQRVHNYGLEKNPQLEFGTLGIQDKVKILLHVDGLRDDDNKRWFAGVMTENYLLANYVNRMTEKIRELEDELSMHVSGGTPKKKEVLH